MQRGMARWEVAMSRLIQLPDKWEFVLVMYCKIISLNIRYNPVSF